MSTSTSTSATATILNKNNPRVFFDITMNNKPQKHRITMELFADVVPKTAENFRCFCTGEKGLSKQSGKPLHYRGSIFHRIIPGFMAQGGDTTRANGTGGESIYGAKFADENFIHKHIGPGMLSMANAGRHTNGSQFFITFGTAAHLNGKHVVFGRVIDGLDVVRMMEKVATGQEDRPFQDVRIADCGQIKDEPTPDASTSSESTTNTTGTDTDTSTDTSKSKSKSKSKSTSKAAPTSTPTSTSTSTSTSTARSGSNSEEISLSESESDSESPAASSAPGSSSAVPAESMDAAIAREENELKQQATQPMNDRQKKLFELKMKLNASRKENSRAAKEEHKRFTEPTNTGKQIRASLAASKSDWRAEMLAQGENPDQPHLYETAEAVNYREKKDKKKSGTKPASFGWDVFNSDAQHNAYKKRLAHVKNKQLANAIASSTTATLSQFQSQSQSHLTEADSLIFNDPTLSKSSEAGIDHMVAELKETAGRRAKFSRRRAFNEDEDVSYINERNRVFNKKIKRAYDQYTIEIANSLERGTAL